MNIGTALVAPEGYRSLAKGETYYFIRALTTRPYVLLAAFCWTDVEEPSVNLLKIPHADFAQAMSSGYIAKLDNQPYLPPWVGELDAQHLVYKDNKRPNAKKSHLSRVEERLATLQPALEQLEGILESKDVKGMVGKIAKTKSLKSSRYCFQLFSYICFGCNKWALMPRFQNCGSRDRLNVSIQKQGRPSKAFGMLYGFRMTEEMVKLCIEGYYRYCKLRVPMRQIYLNVVTKIFGCSTTTGTYGIEYLVHPDGEPFPTENQFRYHVKKVVGLEQIQLNRFGSMGFRNKKKVPAGKFTEQISYLLQKVECDGYYIKELPRGYQEGSALRPICAVVAMDLQSGMILGAGFSYGSEVLEAYKAMLFCMVIPKPLWAMLWGLEIERDEWPCEGFPLDFKLDRGPGFSPDLFSAELSPGFVFYTPSNMPQSKGGVEASHPRTIRIEKPASHVQSALTPAQLIVKEILNVITHNNSSDMSDRMECDIEMDGILPTPVGIWDHYEKLGRITGTRVTVEAAVRTCLTPIKVILNSRGVWLDGRWYWSSELADSKWTKQLARGSENQRGLNGYALQMCLLHIWVEMPDGELLLLKGRTKTFESDDILKITLEDHENSKKTRAVTESAFRIHRSAVSAKNMLKFEEFSGESWDSGVIKAGRPKKTSTAVQEDKEVRALNPRKHK